MKLKWRIQGFIIGIIISVFGIPVLASTVQKTISVSYNNIKLYVDGVLITPKDGNGNVVEPFVYDGTTYLPVRAVGEALDKSVDWDGGTQSVYIGERLGSTAYLGEQVKAYTRTTLFIKEYPDSGKFEMAGNTYTHGLFKYEYTLNDDSALYNLDSKYTLLTGLYGPTDNAVSGRSCVINIYGDNRILASYDSKFGDLPKEFSVDVTDVVQLKIEFAGYNNFAIANAYLN